MKKIIKFLPLFIIVTLAFVLRFWHLGTNPVGFHRDEAFLGYNAYSIMKTGRDMSGNFLPFHLQSFIYDPAGYAYASIPFIFLFGLNEFSVRFASAFFGSLTVLFTYYFVIVLLENDNVKKSSRRHKFFISNTEFIGLTSAFFLSISPWHINASRTVTENTLVVFLVVLGTLLFYIFIKKRKTYLLLLAFGTYLLTFAVYHAPGSFLPFFIPLVVLINHRSIQKRFRLLIVVLFILCVLLPLGIMMISPTSSLRLRTVSIFASPDVQLKIDDMIRQDGVRGVPVYISRFVHNKLIGFTQQILSNYFSYFSYDFLFGDKVFPTRIAVIGTGLMYLAELPLLLLGMYFLIRQNSRFSKFILLWLLIAPIGSALTFDDVPNMQRTLIIQPALSIVIASGAYFLIIHQTKIITKIAALIIFICLLVNVFQYLHFYYLHQPLTTARYRNDGYKQLVAAVNTLLPHYDHALITNADTAPTVFFLFYNTYDPASFQKQTVNSNKVKSDSVNFNRYQFSESPCPLNDIIRFRKGYPEPSYMPTNEENNVLYVDYGDCEVATRSAELIKTINRFDGTRAFQILRFLPNQ